MSLTTSTESFNFLRLPRKARDLVYENVGASDLPYRQELVSNYEVISLEGLAGATEQQPEFQWPHAINRFHADPAYRHGASLRQTCRQVRSEFDEAFERTLQERDPSDATTWRVDIVFDPSRRFEQVERFDRGPLVHWRQLPCSPQAVSRLSVTLWLGDPEPWEKCRYGLYPAYRARHQLFKLLNLLCIKGPALWSLVSRPIPLKFDLVEIEERAGVHLMYREPGPQAKIDYQGFTQPPYRTWMRDRGLVEIQDFVGGDVQGYPALYLPRGGGLFQSFGEFLNDLHQFNQEHGEHQDYPRLPIFREGILGPEDDPMLWSLGEHDFFDSILVRCRVASPEYNVPTRLYTVQRGEGWSDRLRWVSDMIAQRIS